MPLKYFLNPKTLYVCKFGSTTTMTFLSHAHQIERGRVDECTVKCEDFDVDRYSYADDEYDERYKRYHRHETADGGDEDWMGCDDETKNCICKMETQSRMVLQSDGENIRKEKIREKFLHIVAHTVDDCLKCSRKINKIIVNDACQLTQIRKMLQYEGHRHIDSVLFVDKTAHV